jgi:hypothetical protein
MSFDLLGWLSISSGWPVMLSSRKALLETGEALPLLAWPGLGVTTHLKMGGGRLPPGGSCP